MSDPTEYAVLLAANRVLQIQRAELQVENVHLRGAGEREIHTMIELEAMEEERDEAGHKCQDLMEALYRIKELVAREPDDPLETLDPLETCSAVYRIANIVLERLATDTEEEAAS